MASAKSNPAPPLPKRTCADFLREWQGLSKHFGDVELDFSFQHDAITITDMRIPSALRTGVLYTRHEVADGIDRIHGDFAKRIQRFMANGATIK